MNIFKKAIKFAKETIDEFRLNSNIKAGYEVYKAEKKRDILDLENDIQDAIIKGKSFEEILDLYEDLQCAKEDLVDADECLEYLFDEEKTEK